MWVKPTAFGGQVGLPISGDQESQYTSTSILYRQFEPIILNGMIFYKLYPNVPTTVTSAGGTPGWNAVDLRTGELLWHKDTNDTLVFGLEYAIPHYTGIWNTSIPSSDWSKCWVWRKFLQRLATLRPNDWILHCQHHKRSKHNRIWLS